MHGRRLCGRGKRRQVEQRVCIKSLVRTDVGMARFPPGKSNNGFKKIGWRKKTPGMRHAAQDRGFLRSLPEFAEAFASPQKLGTVVPVKNRRGRTAVYRVFLLLAMTASIFMFILKNAN